MEGLVVTILKQGGLAFLGCKITKSLGQKEISEIIAASGWCVVGMAGVDAVNGIAEWVSETATSFREFIDVLTFWN